MRVVCSIRRGLELVLAAAILTVAGPAFGSGSVATTQISMSSISWQPTGSYESVELRLSGGDDISIARTYPDESLAVTAAELSDGSYTYELRATPQGAGALQDQKEAAEAAGQDDEVARLADEIEDLYTSTETVQSGAFTVSNGSIDAQASEEGGE